MKQVHKNKKEELFALMSAQHDGLLDEESNERLAELLSGDAEAQRYYLELGMLFHELEETYHSCSAESLVEEFTSPRAKIVPLLGWAAAIAASLVAAFLLIPRQKPKPSQLLVDAESTILMDHDTAVIRVVNATDVVWGQDNTVTILNDELKRGMLDLQSGTLDVVLDNGVRIGFIAPTKMDITSLKRLSLESGNLIIDVPGLSDSVVINTPDAVLTANTALASVQCDAQGSTLIELESGAAQIYTEDTNGREVNKQIVGKEAVRVARGTEDPIANTRWVTEPRIEFVEPHGLENLQYVHYRFDQWNDGTIYNEGTVAHADGRVVGTPEYPSPAMVPGRFRDAMELSGHGEGMIADIREFDSDEPGTVAFWIKMDPGTVPGNYENIFAWHMYSTPQKKWHVDDEKELACSIRVNNDPARGVVGAVRIAFRDRWICGTTDLRDGRWHHVAAVFHRGYQGTVIRHYIDGQLARSSARGKTWLSTDRHTRIGGGSIAVGCLLWRMHPKDLDPAAPCGLRGAVDELYVFNQAILPSQINRLYMKNRPDQRIQVSCAPLREHAIAMIPVSLGK